MPHKLIIVNNHSFDPTVQEYLRNLRAPFLTIVDPGKNLGCHEGWNFGYKYIDLDCEFVSKIDDDVEVPKNWAENLITAYDTFESVSEDKIAFLGADLDCRSNASGLVSKVSNFTFETPSPIISFSCVIFRSSIIKQFGLMKGSGFYGHEESYYLNLAKKHNYKAFWLKDVLVHHIDPKFKDWNYLVWKLSYGFFALTRKDYDSFVKSDDLRKGWLRLVEYYLKTKRQDLRKDEDPIAAVQNFIVECKKHHWSIPIDLQTLISHVVD